MALAKDRYLLGGIEIFSYSFRKKTVLGQCHKYTNSPRTVLERSLNSPSADAIRTGNSPRNGPRDPPHCPCANTKTRRSQSDVATLPPWEVGITSEDLKQLLKRNKLGRCSCVVSRLANELEDASSAKCFSSPPLESEGESHLNEHSQRPTKSISKHSEEKQHGYERMEC